MLNYQKDLSSICIEVFITLMIHVIKYIQFRTTELHIRLEKVTNLFIVRMHFNDFRWMINRIQ